MKNDITTLEETKKKSSLRSPKDLIEKGLVKKSEESILNEINSEFSIAMTPEMLSQVHSNNDADPIYRQFVPNKNELMTLSIESTDPIGDDVFTNVKGIIHRYPDRCLFKPVNVCAVYCRFCFRREKVGPGNAALNPEELEQAFSYIENNKQIWEVILTGGDPLIMKPKKLDSILQRLNKISHIGVIRIHTRIPVVDPMRITSEMCTVLSSYDKPLYIVIHANHKNEFTKESENACRLLTKHAIPLLCQSVLLKGINDNIEALSDLMRTLITNRIKPYYLHQGDLARGTSHFRTTIKKGQELMSELRGRFSGLCQPTYVLDIPGGFGKVPIQKSYITKSHFSNNENYIIEDYLGMKHHYPDKEDAKPLVAQNSLKYDNQFWDTFIEQYWNQKGILINSFNLITQEKVFKILKIVSKKYLSLGKFGDLKFYLSGKQVINNLIDYLPNEEDSDLETYLQRLDFLTNESEFMIYINKIEQYDSDLWFKVKKFIQNYRLKTNKNSASVEMELFLGRYSKTPGGIHKDGCENYHYVVSGEKTFYMWPRDLSGKEYGEISQHCSSNEAYLDHANLDWEIDLRQDIHAQAGQLIYCPYDWWHAAQSKSTNMAVNFAVYWDEIAKSTFSNALYDLLENFSKNSHHDMYSKLKEYTNTIINKLTDPAWDENLKERNLIFETSYGLSACPNFDSDNLVQLDDVLKLNENTIYKTYKNQHNQFIIVVNGKVISFNDYYLVDCILKLIINKKIFKANDIFVECCKIITTKKDKFLEIINQFYKSHLIEEII